jgi:uncharacterized protein (DUF1800 family)
MITEEHCFLQPPMRRSKRLIAGLLLACTVVFPQTSLFSQTSPVLTNVSTNLPQVNLQFDPYPSADAYTFLSSSNLNSPLVPNTNFFLAPYNQSTNVMVYGTNRFTNYLANYVWRLTNPPPAGFYKLQVTPMSSNALLAATALNRLAYGPTPDELERILTGPSAIGAQAFINEQLAPWNITENVASFHTNISFIEAKFCDATNLVGLTNAAIADLRAWHCLRAVGANRQLLEILLQFLENHFVTQYTKTYNYFDTYYDDGNMQNRLATQFEYLENQKWRAALLNPQCTFYDLLKISAESPAMIIYLDTVSSKGNGSNIANENYARELMELFTMGVDNGYDQNDITVMSRCWTGWTVEKVDFTNVYNPFALVSTNIIPGSTNLSTTTKSNLYAAWTFNYKSNSHNTTTKTIFPNKVIPARFGVPYTTKKYGTNAVAGVYQLVVPGRTSTNGIKEGYEVIQHIADLPFTQEYISIKLCRLFIHDNFPNPSDDTNSPIYDFYNYSAGNLSPEADLVHQCMLTWENSNPKGQIWPVLSNIFNSDLFRTQANSQKVKTPLEFTISAIRALRSSTNGSNLAGSFTSFTDGYAIATPLSRMGTMNLFDRDAPDGYPEAGPPWISAGTIAERLRYVQAFCIANGQSGHTDAGNSMCDIVGLLKAKLPSNQWNNASAVADYILKILYPGEGAGNLLLYKTSAVNYLNTDDNGNASAFSSLVVSGTANSTYDNRVRGMVGMLMTQQRFQEQ